MSTASNASLFTRLDKPVVTCEIHLLIESRRRMFPQDYGYCGRKAKWWWESYGLCELHKQNIERMIKEGKL